MGIRTLERKTMNILSMTNEHPDFYRLIGPFLARREIAREMGQGNLSYGAIWDDDGKQWFIAMDNNKVAGFATMLARTTVDVVVFCEAYVLPEYRNQSIHSQLIDARIAHCPQGSTIQVIASSSSIHQYITRGFTIKRERGKDFVEMTKKVGGK